jgi:Tfp pilus assembly protein PilN
MKTRLNLASQPFRNRGLPWTVTAVITAVSLLALVLIVRSTFQWNAQAQSIQRDIKDLQSRSDVKKRQADELKAALTPDQKRTLRAAHALVDRKRFSWTRLFADLESALPGGVRVSRIIVKEANAQGDRTVADLDLTVVSKSPTTVTDMIEQMEREGVFHAELVAQNPQRGRNESGAEYEMNVHYVPRAGAAIAISDRASHAVDTAANGRSTK